MGRLPTAVNGVLPQRSEERPNCSDLFSLNSSQALNILPVTTGVLSERSGHYGVPELFRPFPLVLLPSIRQVA